MSVHQQALVWGLKLKHNEAWVLMCLADASHPDGSKAFPGVPTIAWMTGYEERQVRRVLARLRDLGVIEVVADAHGGQRPTEYQLHLDRAVKKSPLVKAARCPDKKSARPDTAKTARPDTAMSDEPSVTIKEPSGEPPELPAHAREDPLWVRELRDIDDWASKGEPHMVRLIEWAAEKGWTGDQLERSAIGLAAVSTKILKGYTNMASAFQRRLNMGYDERERIPPGNGRAPRAGPGGPSRRVRGWRGPDAAG